MMNANKSVGIKTGKTRQTHKTIVQVSLDLTDINEALEMAHTAMRAGVDWLEAGTPFILAEGLHGVRALRKEDRKSTRLNSSHT